MDHIWTEFQGSLKYIGKMVSGFIVPSCFLETHALGPRKGTWYYAEEFKLETNTVLNSPASIQFPKSNEETSFLFREALEDKNVITLITLPYKTKAMVSEQKLYFWGPNTGRLFFLGN